MANALEACVSSLRTSLDLLNSSISILNEGVKDLPRLGKVLETKRHFELIPEPTLHTAQSALLAEIRPEVDALLSRVATYLDKLERREQSLIAKCELQQGRLSQDSAPVRRPSQGRGQSGLGLGGQGQGGDRRMQELKVRQLRQKKERLSYAVGRLELQAQQRERQLRQSLAAGRFDAGSDVD